MSKKEINPVRYRIHILMHAPAIRAMTASERERFLQAEVYPAIAEERARQHEEIKAFMKKNFALADVAGSCSPFELSQEKEQLILSRVFETGVLDDQPDHWLDFNFEGINDDPEVRKLHHMRRRKHLLIEAEMEIFFAFKYGLREKLVNNMATSREDLFPGKTPLDEFHRAFMHATQYPDAHRPKLVSIDLIG